MSYLLEWQDGFLVLQSAVCTAEAVPQTAEPRFGSSYTKTFTKPDQSFKNIIFFAFKRPSR